MRSVAGPLPIHTAGEGMGCIALLLLALVTETERTCTGRAARACAVADRHLCAMPCRGRSWPALPGPRPGSPGVIAAQAGAAGSGAHGWMVRPKLLEGLGGTPQPDHDVRCCPPHAWPCGPVR